MHSKDFPLEGFLNNFIIRFLFIYLFIHTFFGDYIIRQCYKIVINKLFEGKKNRDYRTENKKLKNLKLNLN